MQIDLDKDDLISLVKGSEPNYSAMKSVEKYGQYYDQYGRWQWDTNNLNKCSEEQLLEIYKTCKSSWK